ncbi:MAG: hypothetical protein LBT62_05045 [Deltaproteobacteria bacterium]|nr:hypothetical protein [Deltaproteobacteria bacterium]
MAVSGAALPDHIAAQAYLDSTILELDHIGAQAHCGSRRRGPGQGLTPRPGSQEGLLASAKEPTPKAIASASTPNPHP